MLRKIYCLVLLLLALTVIMPGVTPAKGHEKDYSAIVADDNYNPQDSLDTGMMKDTNKIMIKFILWTAFIISGMLILNKALPCKKVHTARHLFLAAAVLVFGIWLGSAPNPVGTISDTLVLYGRDGSIFKPRLILMAAFLITVVLGGRMFCGWGCPFGTLQELFYQLPFAKFRVPFKYSQTVRFIFSIVLAVLALGWGFNLIGAIDPFNIFNFKPLVFWGSTVTAAGILVLGIFFYRPWCTFLCPFGLMAWLFEKTSFFGLRVHKETCAGCGLCLKICPTGAIEAKHKGYSKKDCYNCGICMDNCPAGAISYGKRSLVAKGGPKLTV